MQQLPPTGDEHWENVDAAFSAQAPHFDEVDRNNPILQWMRRQVHQQIAKHIHPGDSMLDINAGTGIDAVHFAQLGHRVVAVDIAAGMVREMERKVAEMNLSSQVTVQRGSFSNLASLAPAKFNYVLSNFGGLNCVADLRPIAQQLTEILNPGAVITLVIMPRVCPWEMLHIVNGNFRLAFRRFRRNGTIARIEGHPFLTTYHSSTSVCRSFGPRFKMMSLTGLASISPPPYVNAIPLHCSRLYGALTTLDESLSAVPPFNRWADHFILTLSFRG